MALARLISRGQAGLDAFEVSVEVHLAGGLPGFTITGLPTAAVRESRDRVRAALQTCGLPIPAQRVTVHLGPADVPKDGGRFDLAIALGIVKASQRADWITDGLEFVGELALGGELRPVTGAVPAALAATAAGRRLVLPRANGPEAMLVPDTGRSVLVADQLAEVVASLDGRGTLATPAPSRVPSRKQAVSASLDDVRGHAQAKRALAIAAAGGHNLLLIGPPGSGKSMLAERMVGLLPPLDDRELLSVLSIASVAGRPTEARSGGDRPFRAPHHTTTATALVGGGARPKPGEVSLAHHGILFLDELPEFSRAALEALREPLEARRVAIARLGHSIAYPADFQLIAAMNPCPCGYFGDGSERCRCTPTRITQYRARISGPLLDRFDLHIDVPQVAVGELTAVPVAGAASALREQVLATRRLQQDTRGALNARLDDALVWRTASLDAEASTLLAAAQERWRLSTRSVVRVLRVSRTIADMKRLDRPGSAEVGEALQLRRLDRPFGGDTV